MGVVTVVVGNLPEGFFPHLKKARLLQLNTAGVAGHYLALGAQRPDLVPSAPARRDRVAQDALVGVVERRHRQAVRSAVGDPNAGATPSGSGRCCAERWVPSSATRTSCRCSRCWRCPRTRR